MTLDTVAAAVEQIEKSPLIVSYGAGINSTAMLCGFVERNIVPDAILFADTGGEKPATYKFLEVMDAWLAKNNMPMLTRLKYRPSRAGSQVWESLEHECLGSGTLPSLAYGWHKCSAKWKVDPQMKWLSDWEAGQAAIADGHKIRKAIGFRVGEERRRKDHIQDPGTVKVYPLLEWKWDQEDCRAAITRAGLPMPPKSSCFFCPASARSEVAKLALQHPELFDRAVAMERNARASGNLQTVVGLGRNYTWESVGAAARAQCTLPGFDSSETPCGCYDGDDD